MWIFLDGVDVSGKSTAASFYKSKGYKYIHFTSPSKKYYDGSSGPSYFEDVVNLYSSLSQHNVVFDRTPLGELVWSQVFNRKVLLSEDDLVYLKELEADNEPVYYYFWDENKEAHWNRCVERREKLTRYNFDLALELYWKVFVKENDYQPIQLPEFQSKIMKLTKSVSQNHTAELAKKPSSPEYTNVPGPVSQPEPQASNNSVEFSGGQRHIDPIKKTDEQVKLEKANAINAILSTRILKKSGSVFDEIELEVSSFLKDKLKLLLGTNQFSKSSFTDEEINILKLYAERIKKQYEGKN